MSDAIARIMNEEINGNKELSDYLKEIALDLFDTVHGSELYGELSINASHPHALHGHIGFDSDIESHETCLSLPGCSIDISSFELTEDKTLKIKKKVSIGFNTNSDVEHFAGHDYIAPSVNCTMPSVESFEINNASDILDVIDSVCQRSIDEQIAAIKDLDGVKFGNGESFEVLLAVKNKVDNGEGVKFSFFKSNR